VVPSLRLLVATLATLALGAAVGAGCGSSPAGHPPDAGAAVDAAPPDAGFPACREFAGPAVHLPAHVVGALVGADLQSPRQCAVVDAPFGTESSGPDGVVAIDGLTAGAAYIVHLTAPADLAFYVATGCATATGPSVAECLLFEDASSGPSEHGRFVATGDRAYVVVDDYSTHAPADPSFVLDVYAEECQVSTQCGGATPVCDDGRCVECDSSFACQDPARPVCDLAADADACVAGAHQCARDDAREDGDDGPIGATALAVDGSGAASLAGTLCGAPTTERDFAAFEVTSLGETWDLELAWAGSADLDLIVRDARGEVLGMSYWEQPEHVRLTYLPLGRYVVELREFVAVADPTPTDYTLTAHRTLGAGCGGDGDCATEYRNQLFRGRCDAGACVAIDGGGAVPTGGACDSGADCVAGDRCPSFYFVADAQARDRCAPTCAGDGDCAQLGDVCTTYLATNLCVAPCTADAQCPTAPDQAPTSGPWRRLRCDLPTGRCLP
jgi:hypothetical protein